LKQSGLSILHIIDSITGAGPTRSVIALAKYARELGLNHDHRMIALQAPCYPPALFDAKRAGMAVMRNPDRATIRREMGEADIVQVHYWNHPGLSEFLREEWPEMRLLVWLKILGAHPPQVVTEELLKMADRVVAGSPLTFNLPVFKERMERDPEFRSGMIYGMADWSRLDGVKPKPHDFFQVGYIGTVNYTKMHPGFIRMSSAATVPGIKFVICGSESTDHLKDAARNAGTLDRFDFKGYVEQIGPVLSTLDVFGYPLCEDTYATSEKSLQEAMYAGVPPIVFPHGGCADLVEHEQTGLVVNIEREYSEAIEYLYHHPETRKELGRNAAKAARSRFDSRQSVRKMHRVYEEMMASPKRKRRWPQAAIGVTPASRFAESLGEFGESFAISLRSDSVSEILNAEKNIEQTSTLVARGEGGIIQHRNRHPDDPFLRLWTGLILLGEGKLQNATSEFQSAVELGLDKRRIEPYLKRIGV
jgi:hypothetical protein